jgi:hypothetical protein
LNEARTNPDGEEVNLAHDPHLSGWYSYQANSEVGDFPIRESNQLFGTDSKAFWYEPLVNGQEKVPIQLLYSNAVHGPEDPFSIKYS